MNINDLRKNWDELGRVDPFWAILTCPDKKGNKWKIEEFFETGRQEIELLMERIGSLGISLSLGKALDFGCGVGRLTQPLTKYFDEVYGVDIARSMIDLARKYNRHEGRCRYFVNEVDNLDLFSDDAFSLIYSSLTLQHMDPKHIRKYLKELVRVLSPDGLLVFQLPSEPAGRMGRWVLRSVPSFLLNVHRRMRFHNSATIEMHAMKRNDVVELIKSNGAYILEIEEDKSAGDEWLSYRYFVIKKRMNPAKFQARMDSGK